MTDINIRAFLISFGITEIGWINIKIIFLLNHYLNIKPELKEYSTCTFVYKTFTAHIYVLLTSRHTVVCRAAQEAGAPHP